MSKLEKLTEATKGMSLMQKSMFEGYFIGSLSILTTDENWDTALDTAKTCMEKYYPEQAEVSRG